MGIVFGLQTLLMMDFTKIYQLKGLENKGHATWSFMNVSFDEKLYLAMVLKSILSILFHWQNGGYLPKSRPRSYIHMIIWRDAARSIPIRFVFVIFTIQWLIFLRMIWFFFSTHKFHLYVEMSNLLNLKKCFQHRYMVE